MARKRCKAKTNAGIRCARTATCGDYCEIRAHRRQGKGPKPAAKQTRTGRKRARDHTDRTVAKAKKYLAALEGGRTRTSAAAAAGLSRFTTAELRRDASPFGDDEDGHTFAELEVVAEETAVGDVEDALKKAATTTDDHGKYNTGAIAFFLKNRAPDKWKDMKTHELVDRVKQQDREVFFQALEAAGVSDKQIERALAILAGEPDAGLGANSTVH